VDNYDFDYGDDLLLDLTELKSDGAIVQLGYEKNQPNSARGKKDSIFFTRIPFEFTQQHTRALP